MWISVNVEGGIFCFASANEFTVSSAVTVNSFAEPPKRDFILPQIQVNISLSLFTKQRVI